jgi:hypothetical protein
MYIYTYVYMSYVMHTKAIIKDSVLIVPDLG